MQEFKLTVDRQIIEEIYGVDKIKKKWTSMKFYLPIIFGIILITGVGFSLFLKENKVLIVFGGLLSIGISIFLFFFWWKNYLAEKKHVKSVEQFILKTLSYSSNVLKLDERSIQLHRDEEFHIHYFSDLKEIYSEKNFINLSFSNGGSLLLPKKSFKEGEYDIVKDRLKNISAPILQ